MSLLLLTDKNGFFFLCTKLILHKNPSAKNRQARKKKKKSELHEMKHTGDK